MEIHVEWLNSYKEYRSKSAKKTNNKTMKRENKNFSLFLLTMFIPRSTMYKNT